MYYMFVCVFLTCWYCANSPMFWRSIIGVPCRNALIVAATMSIGSGCTSIPTTDQQQRTDCKIRTHARTHVYELHAVQITELLIINHACSFKWGLCGQHVHIGTLFPGVDDFNCSFLNQQRKLQETRERERDRQRERGECNAINLAERET